MSATAGSVFAIVPARGGSKGIVDKNVVELGGRPLIAHTLGALGEAREVAEHVVSTDDPVIAAVAQEHGGVVPYLRPPELARDDTRINDVVRELVEHLGVTHDYLLLLQPTAPLRAAGDIDAAITLAREYDASSVVSLAEVETYHPWAMYYLEGTRMTPVGSEDHARPRQQYPKVGWRNGAIYLVKTAVFLAEDTFVTEDCVPYVMPAERSVNVDTEEDLWLAEYYLRKLKTQNAKLKTMESR